MTRLIRGNRSQIAVVRRQKWWRVPVSSAHRREILPGIPCGHAHSKGHRNPELVGPPTRYPRDPAGSADVKGALIPMAATVTEQQAREVVEAARETEWKLPSFGKELFLGNFRLDLIHPQPALDPTAVEKGERFLQSLRAFLEEHVDPLQIERDAKIPDSVIDGLKQLGALGMKVPEQYGGLGLSRLYYNRALALAASAHAAISTMLSAHQSIGVAEPLMLFGTEEQKRTWLPLVATDHISAFLLPEPDVGSDPARLGTIAAPTADGTGYVLNGLKLWAPHGAIPDIVVGLGQGPRHDRGRGGITAFVMTYD